MRAGWIVGRASTTNLCRSDSVALSSGQPSGIDPDRRASISARVSDPTRGICSTEKLEGSISGSAVRLRAGGRSVCCGGEEPLIKRRVHRSSNIQRSQRFFQLAAEITFTVLFSLPTYLFSCIQIPVARSRSGLRMKESDSLEEPLLPRSSLPSASKEFSSCPQSGFKSHRNECTNLEENN